MTYQVQYYLGDSLGRPLGWHWPITVIHRSVLGDEFGALLGSELAAWVSGSH
jgi:hypothetical protein